MSSLAEWFGWNNTVVSDELPEIYPMPVTSGDFISTEIVAIYSKILTDVLERTQGLSDDQVALMWDSCVKSSSSDGLITRLAKAMANKQDLYLVYERALGVIRVATGSEQQQIRTDYETQTESKVGTYISFKNFDRSDMVKFYIGLEYYTVASLYKTMNLSKSIQIKISDLRGSVSVMDSAEVKAQAKKIADALGAGRDVLMDAKDEIENAVPDLTAVKESMGFLLDKLAFYLGLPDSYITGEQTTGIGSTGENDMRAVERGLKNYFFSIIKPTLQALFDGVKLSYKSQDFRQIENASNILKTFALIDDTLISSDNKRMIINRLLDLPAGSKGDPAPKVLPAPATDLPPARPPFAEASPR